MSDSPRLRKLAFSPRLKNLAKAYTHLVHAQELLRHENVSSADLSVTMTEIAEEMAREWNPRTVSDVCRFPYANVERVAWVFLVHVMEGYPAPEEPEYYVGGWCELVRDVGALKVLAAPVETPAELAAWLRSQKAGMAAGSLAGSPTPG